MIIVTTLIMMVSIHPNLIGQTSGLSPLTLWMADFSELGAVAAVTCFTGKAGILVVSCFTGEAGILVAFAG